LKDTNATLQALEEQKNKYETDLKTSIDKIYDLREIIADLEAQVAAKTMSEKFLNDKCQELENYIDHQNVANESLKDELDKVKSDIDDFGYEERVRYLEDQLRINANSSSEPKSLIDQMSSQLKMIEVLLDRKTKTLESFHALTVACNTACSSPSEDVSRGVDFDASEQSPIRMSRISTEGSNLPFEGVQRILDKLSKHNRIEEATVKKITDLEMQANVMRGNLVVSIK
jgi:hypothetical protein